MTSAAWALHKSLHSTLASDAQVLELLGGPRIYDRAPRNAKFPYVVYAQSAERDWSTGSEPGNEHVLTMHVWSRAGSRGQTHEIMSALQAALHDRALTVPGHRLVNLRHELSEARPDPDGETFHGIVRYRAVTEPLAQV